MLPKKRRINKVAFKDLLAGSAFGASPHFSIRFKKSPPLARGAPRTPSTFSIVVSKKVAALAVERNKIKRRCYHALRGLAPDVKDSYKFALFAKRGAEALSFEELQGSIRAVLAKNGLIH